MVCVREGRGKLRAHSSTICILWICPGLACCQAPPPPTKSTKLHDSLFSNFALSKSPHTRICPTPWVSPEQIKSTALFLPTVHPCIRKWSRLRVIRSKENEEQREDMLLSPVCVPSVCKLHQQHELNQQENEATNGSYVTPHCGIEQRKRQEICFLDEKVSRWTSVTYCKMLHFHVTNYFSLFITIEVNIFMMRPCKIYYEYQPGKYYIAAALQ